MVNFSDDDMEIVGKKSMVGSDAKDMVGGLASSTI